MAGFMSVAVTMRQGGRAVLRRGGSAAQATRCLHHHRQRHQLMPAALGVSSRIVADSASSLTPATLATTTQRALLHIMNNGSRSGSSSGHSSGDANNTAASALAWTTSPASSDNNTNDDARRLLGDGGDTGLNFELRSPLLMARRPFHVATPSLEAAKKESTKNRILIELIADESKVEQKVKRLLTQKLKEQKNPAYNLIIDKRAMEDADKKAKAAAKKAPIYKRIWTKQFWTDMYRAAVREAQHYKAGFQLLWTDIRLSFRYLRRVLNGEQLSRRERKQFVRTAGDIFRLVPFSAFIIVPGMELLLPFAIKFFPGMLPSQFQETKTKLARQKAELRVKLDMAKFLQATLEDMALSKGKGSTKHTSLAAEFTKFLEENRKAGYVPASAILKYAPLFKDNLTLDTLDAPQLRALCKLLNVPSIGSIAMLRFQLRTRLRALHADDLIIAKEGVGSLTTSELQAACRERGMRALGMSAEGLRQRLQQWLDLHILHGVPPTLLLLSRVLFLPESVPEPERIRAVLESLPDDLTAQVQAELLEAEGEGVDAKLRLKIIAAEEERIKREQMEKEKEKEEEEKRSSKAEEEEVRDTAPIVPPTAEDEQVAPPPKPTRGPCPPTPSSPPSATPTTTTTTEAPATSLPPSTEEPPPGETTPPLAPPTEATALTDEDKLTLEDCLDLALVITELSGQKEVAPAFQALKEEVEDHKGDLKELQEYGGGTIRESVASLRLSNRVERLLRKVESSMSEIDLAALAQLDLDRDGVISREELMSAMAHMKNSPKQEKMQRWADILDADHDGKLKLDTLQKVLNLIAYEGVDVHPDHLQAIVDLVEKQDQLTGDEDVQDASDTAVDVGHVGGADGDDGGDDDDDVKTRDGAMDKQMSRK